MNAYIDNMIDVATLLDDSEAKGEAITQAQLLEEELSHTHDKLSELEEESMGKIGEGLMTACVHMAALNVVFHMAALSGVHILKYIQSVLETRIHYITDAWSSY